MHSVNSGNLFRLGVATNIFVCTIMNEQLFSVFIVNREHLFATRSASAKTGKLVQTDQ